VALRPRLSPGVPLSRCGRYTRAVYPGCQASLGIEPEEARGMVRVNPNQLAWGFANTVPLDDLDNGALGHAHNPGVGGGLLLLGTLLGAGSRQAQKTPRTLNCQRG
jgi:hypothetical protein